MEIALLSKSGLRIKGKQATLAVDPQDKTIYEAVLLMNKTNEEVTKSDDSVIIVGTGEYEIGGVKLTGTRTEGSTIYSMIVDGVSILLGNLKAIEGLHAKLKDHNIVIINCSEVGNSSFITSLVENVIILFGDKASDVAQTLGKENIKTMNKYSSTKDKLPSEVETIVLASGI